MGYLIDTNVLSELCKPAWADPGVAPWYVGAGARIAISKFMKKATSRVQGVSIGLQTTPSRYS